MIFHILTFSEDKQIGQKQIARHEEKQRYVCWKTGVIKHPYYSGNVAYRSKKYSDRKPNLQIGVLSKSVYYVFGYIIYVRTRIIKQLLDEAEYDMKNYADQGGCYPPKPKAEVDNTLRGLHNSSYHTKAEFNNCFISQSKYFQNFEIIKM